MEWDGGQSLRELESYTCEILIIIIDGLVEA